MKVDLIKLVADNIPWEIGKTYYLGGGGTSTVSKVVCDGWDFIISQVPNGSSYSSANVFKEEHMFHCRGGQKVPGWRIFNTPEEAFDGIRKG